MKLPTARDFAGLLGLEIEGTVLGPKEVANKLRRIIDLLDREDNRPHARLEEAYSIESARKGEITETTLVLTFSVLADPEEFYRKLEEEREARKK